MKLRELRQLNKELKQKYINLLAVNRILKRKLVID